MAFYKKIGNNYVGFYVADSYETMEPVSEPFENSKGKLYITLEAPCKRCGGSGNYGPLSVDNGRCFSCHGTGKERIDVRCYTEEEHNKYQTRKGVAAKRKELKRLAEEQEKIKNFNEYKHKEALRLGFGENECIYVVYGGDTYSIKEKIKELGGKFNYDLGWYFSTFTDKLPNNYKLCEIHFEEVYIYEPNYKWATIKEDAKDIIKKRIAESSPPAATEYYPAEIKDRLRNIKVTVSKIRNIESEYYGSTNIYTFTLDKYVFVWMTSSAHPELTIGAQVNLTGTVKKFDEYDGIYQTYLSHCLIREVE